MQNPVDGMIDESTVAPTAEQQFERNIGTGGGRTHQFSRAAPRLKYRAGS
jgi:hypothetical protein